MRRISPQHRQQPAGVIITEVAVGISLMAMIMIGLVAVQSNTAKVNHQYLVQQRCIAAVQSTLDSIAATGKPIEDSQTSRLWPGITLQVEAAPGQGQFQSLQCVTATAKGPSGSHEVTVTLSRYIAARGG